MKILHLNASVTGDESVSSQLTARIVDSLREAAPAITSYRDLAKDPLPHFTFTSEAKAAHAASLDEFLDADVVVIGAPMHNFAISSQLKAWIDSIAVSGKTFSYTESGPQGLAGSKRVIVASSHDSANSKGPMGDFDFQETYLRTVFRFIGITDVEFVRAEGEPMAA